MANRHRAYFSGGVDSKYYYHPEQFDIDIRTKQKQREDLTNEILSFLESKLQQAPASMDSTFKCIIQAALQLKKKYYID